MELRYCTGSTVRIPLLQLFPIEATCTFTWWWGQGILRAIPAAGYLLVGLLLLDRSKMITLTKRNTLVLQVGGWAWD
jgi:hypothetical protein